MISSSADTFCELSYIKQYYKLFQSSYQIVLTLLENYYQTVPQNITLLNLYQTILTVFWSYHYKLPTFSEFISNYVDNFRELLPLIAAYFFLSSYQLMLIHSVSYYQMVTQTKIF